MGDNSDEFDFDFDEDEEVKEEDPSIDKQILDDIKEKQKAKIEKKELQSKHTTDCSCNDAYDFWLIVFISSIFILFVFWIFYDYRKTRIRI